LDFFRGNGTISARGDRNLAEMNRQSGFKAQSWPKTDQIENEKSRFPETTIFGGRIWKIAYLIRQNSTFRSCGRLFPAGQIINRHHRSPGKTETKLSETNLRDKQTDLSRR